MQENIWMNRCLELARHGLGLVAPNPMVGAVLVHENQVIGEGFHHQFGGPHAEVVAINSVRDKDLISQSTLYVNLEPCSHFGKTPPCANLIIEKGIKHVIVGQEDPNALVSGKGIKMLREAGIHVEVGVEEVACRFLNRRFNYAHSHNRPYMILKWAQSTDGFMDRERTASQIAEINWISHPESNLVVHKWRTQEQAILVGYQTIVNDNPRLTPRLIAGKSPLRIVLASANDLPENCHLLCDNEPTLIFHYGPDRIEGVKQWIQTSAENYFADLSSHLMSRNIHSVLVEGGKKTLDSFIKSDWYQEVRIIVSSVILQAGLKAPSFPSGVYSNQTIGRDNHFTLIKS